MYRYLIIVFASLLLSIPSYAQSQVISQLGLLSQVLPDGLGVNIHFTTPRPGEMDMLHDAGITWVRMDFKWSAIEKEKGQYDFSAYDGLVNELDKVQIKPLFILDYSNKLYDNGLSPHTDEGRTAFARWAAVAVKHYKGKAIIWELWNEPNIKFWKPMPNVQDYIKLGIATGKAIRAVDPNAVFIGPATSRIDLPFLESCFKGGMLQYWNAVSVHPYRGAPPETVAAEYRKLRFLIDTYAPHGKTIPIISGEWGYSTRTIAGGVDDITQAQYLVRQWMTNISNDVPLSIWYDWHDDGPDPTENEHNFGVTEYPYFEKRDPIYHPKPAYIAAQTFTSTFRGFHFNKRLDVGDNDSYVLLFSKGEDLRLAAWTSAKTPRQILLPASAGKFDSVDYLGKVLSPLTATSDGLRITVTNAPQYLTPEKPNDLLRVAAAWQRLPLEITGDAPRHILLALSLKNPLQHSLIVENINGTKNVAPGATVQFVLETQLTREKQPVQVKWNFKDLGSLTQNTWLIPLNPLHITVLPREVNQLPVEIKNPASEAFTGALQVENVQGITLKTSRIGLEFKPGETQKQVFLPIDKSIKSTYSLTLRIYNKAGEVLAAPRPSRYILLDNFSHYTRGTKPDDLDIVPDGDPKVLSEQSVVSALPADEPLTKSALRLSYRFDAGWKFIRLVPLTDQLKKIEGRPKALQIWVYSEDENNRVRMRFKDAAGQTFQANGENLVLKKWELVTFPLNGEDSTYWGGDDSGHIQYPIQIDSLILLDGTKQKRSGNIYISAPTLVYE